MNNKLWYAIYTRSRNEKKVNHLLIESGIDTFLPLVKTLKQWSDRKKWVEEPLFKSYLFVHISPDQYYNVLNIPGVVKYIAFEGKAVIVPEKQILAIKHFLNNEEDNSIALEQFELGDKIEINKGSLIGLRGQLLQMQGKQKVKIEIESVGGSVILTIHKSYLKILS